MSVYGEGCLFYGEGCLVIGCVPAKYVNVRHTSYCENLRFLPQPGYSFLKNSIRVNKIYWPRAEVKVASKISGFLSKFFAGATKIL